MSGKLLENAEYRQITGNCFDTCVADLRRFDSQNNFHEFLAQNYAHHLPFFRFSFARNWLKFGNVIFEHIFMLADFFQVH